MTRPYIRLLAAVVLLVSCSGSFEPRDPIVIIVRTDADVVDHAPDVGSDMPFHDDVGEPAPDLGELDVDVDAPDPDMPTMVDPGWTERTSVDEMLIAGVYNIVDIIADPHAAERFAIVMQGRLAIWENGEVVRRRDREEATFDSGGFTSDRAFWAYMRSPSTDEEILMWPDMNGSFSGSRPLGAQMPKWPPSGLAVSPGAGGEAVLFAPPYTYRIVDVLTGQLQSQSWTYPDDMFLPWSEIWTYAAPSLAFLAVSDGEPNALQRCEEGVCVRAATLDNRLVGVWTSPVESDIVYARVQAADGLELRASDDHGESFVARDLPAGWTSFDLAVSPASPTTVVAWTSGNQPLAISDDAGQSWRTVALPDTATTSLAGAFIGTSGTLFILRGNAVYSRRVY